MHYKKLALLLFSWIMAHGSEQILSSYKDYITEQKKNPNLTVEDFEKNYTDYQDTVNLMASAREFTFAQYLAGVHSNPHYQEYLEAQGDWANGLKFQQFLEQRDPHGRAEYIAKAKSLAASPKTRQALTAPKSAIQSAIHNYIDPHLTPQDIFFWRENSDKGEHLYQIRAVQNYIQSGRDVNIESPNGRTPLISAIENDNLELIKLLLQTPTINVNTHNYYPRRASRYPELKGASPLHIAVDDNNNQDNKIAIIKALLAHPKIDPFIKNTQGNTPLQTMHNREVEILLLKKEQEIIAKSFKLIKNTAENLKRANIHATALVNANRIKEGKGPLSNDLLKLMSTYY